MLGYALRRLVLAIPLLIGITLISFSVIHPAPGEPTELGTGDTPIQSDKGVRERLIQMYGLDKPIHGKHWNCLTPLVQPRLARPVAPHAPSPPANSGRRPAVAA